MKAPFPIPVSFARFSLVLFLAVSCSRETTEPPPREEARETLPPPPLPSLLPGKTPHIYYSLDSVESPPNIPPPDEELPFLDAPEHPPESLLAAIKHANPEVRLSALRAAVGAPGSLRSSLATGAITDPDPRVRHAAYDLLDDLPENLARELRHAWLLKGTADIRRRVAEDLILEATEHDFTFLQTLAKSSDSELATLAVEILESYPSGPPGSE